MFKRLFSGSRMTRECHVRFCEKPSGFVGGFTHQYLNLQKAKDSVFRRIVGIKRKTFDQMVKILTEAHKTKKARGGRPNTFNPAEMLLITFEYLREYRTYAHIGMSYGLSESNTYKTIRWVEDTLIKSGAFSLPGKKELLKKNNEIDVVLIDASESPIERPKKNSASFTLAKRKDTLSRPS